MKPPELIKKGLEQCANTETCENCGYRDECMDLCSNKPMTKDALAYIQQLESRLAQAERERAAAVMDIETAIDSKAGLGCHLCKRNGVCDRFECVWEWRGVCAENTEEG